MSRPICVHCGKSYGHLETWEGESWRGGHNPFCTLHCALDYARRAYAKLTAHNQEIARIFERINHSSKESA